MHPNSRVTSRHSCLLVGQRRRMSWPCMGHHNPHDILGTWTMTHLVVVLHRGGPLQTRQKESPYATLLATQSSAEDVLGERRVF